MKLLIFLFFLCSKSWAVLTVCTSGCSDTTVANAIATATATPNSVIQINDNSITNEQDIVSNPNTSLTFQGASQAISWASTSANGVNLSFTGSTGGSVTVQNITMVNKSTGANRLIDCSISSSGTFYLNGIKFIATGDGTSAAKILFNGVLASFGEVIVNNCSADVSCPSVLFLNANALDITTGAILIKNSSFYGHGTNGTALGTQTSTSANSIVECTNDDIVSFGVGMYSFNGGGISAINCLFINNTIDFLGNSTAVTTKLIYCGFGTLPSGAGTSCIYGLTASQELCDNNNYWLSPASQTRNKGTSITGITNTLVGLNGILHGNACTNGNDDMGCNPYSPALCGGYGLGK